MVMRRETRGQTPKIHFDALLREINETTVFFDPPAAFNPLEAGPDELDRYGIPRRPDPATQTGRFAFWKKLFSPPLLFEAAAFSFEAPEIQLNPRTALPPTA